MKINALLIFFFLPFFALAKRPASYFSAKNRVVAIGDIHGDFNALIQALRLARVIDVQKRWIGKNTFLIQVGDLLDRGNDERQLIDFLSALKLSAKAFGGNVFVLNGNHETMNVDLDFRYVTRQGFDDFKDFYHNNSTDDSVLLSFPKYQRGRVIAFRPGGDYALKLSQHNTLMVIGKTLFVHGGLTPKYMKMEIEKINQLVSLWMRGNSKRPELVIDEKGPLWSRNYSSENSAEKCKQLKRVLKYLNLDRMVVAHTVHNQINSECDQKVWRIDVGMSQAYGGQGQVLEILDDKTINILK